MAKVEMAKFAEIVGETAADTTPVMATAAGVLELLPTHLYPRPWLFASVESEDGSFAPFLSLPKGNSYDLYRDMKPSYRLQSISPVALLKGKFVSHSSGGGRTVEIDGRRRVHFEHSRQDIAGDGTVPQQSGAGPEGKVRLIFRTQGYDHQGSYKNQAMLLLTQHLIARIVQEAK